MVDSNLIVWERRMMKEMGQEENRVSISMEDLKDKCISGGRLEEPEVVALCQDNDFQIAGQDSGSYEFDAVHCFRCLDGGTDGNVWQATMCIHRCVRIQKIQR